MVWRQTAGRTFMLTKVVSDDGTEEQAVRDVDVTHYHFACRPAFSRTIMGTDTPVFSRLPRFYERWTFDSNEVTCHRCRARISDYVEDTLRGSGTLRAFVTSWM